MNLFELSAKIGLDTSEYERGLTKSKKSMSEYKSDVMKLAQTYKSQGMTMSDAMKKAYSEIDKSQYETTDQSEKQARRFGINWSEAADKVSGAASKIGNGFQVIGSGIKTISKVGGQIVATGAKVAGAAVAAGAAGITALSKLAIDGYAEYEQLVGGVETLFKDSADQVQQYADNAYQTAGMSANEYMNTVTSFSASLLQGLGGDTDAAAKIANRAITDMSDNANKMGTDMTMIQNAYQGFAKQNYTMLDNLKLGYGGTASEMARLINDSGVLGESIEVTAETVNSVSFDKIIEAIGVVQDRMGITGTTAKEASSTIAGSVSSMKAAWQNLLVGFADPDQDLDALLGNVIDSAVTVANNIIPRISKTLPRIVNGIKRLVDKISEKLPDIVQQLLPPLITGAITLVSSIAQNLPEILRTIWDTVLASYEILKSNFPVLQDAENTLSAIWDGITAFWEKTAAVATQIYEAVSGAFRAVYESVKPLINAIGAAFVEAWELIQVVWDKVQPYFAYQWEQIKVVFSVVKNILGAYFEAAWENIKSVWNVVVAYFTMIWNNIAAVFSVVKNVLTGNFKEAWEGIKSIFANWGKFFQTLFDEIGNIFSNVKSYFTKVGGYIVDGIKQGISNAWNALVNWFNDLWSDVFGDLEISAVINSVGSLFDGSHATGLSYVPYDGYIAELHQGERVLTKREASDYRRGLGGGNTFNITVNGANYADEDALAEAIAEKIQFITEKEAAAYA